MPPVHDPERSGRFGYARLFASHRDGVSGSGDQIINPNAHLNDFPEYGKMRSEQVGELPKHPERLPLLLDLSLAQRIPQLDGLGRLDEQSARTAGLVVNDPGGRLRESRRTGMTYRFPRTVTEASDGVEPLSRPRSSVSSRRSRRCRAAWTSRRAAARRGLAVSSRFPSGSTD